MRIPFSLFVLALVAACVPRAEPPAPSPAPAPAPPPASPPPSPAAAALTGEWRDWPLTPGNWTYRRDARASVAVYGRPGADAALTLRCDLSASRMHLSRSGTGTSPLTVRTTSLTRALPVQPAGGTPAEVTLALAPTDPLLDAMAFSRGRFVVEQAGSPPLVVPAWAEVGRVTEDCRA